MIVDNAERVGINSKGGGGVIRLFVILGVVEQPSLVRQGYGSGFRPSHR